MPYSELVDKVFALLKGGQQKIGKYFNDAIKQVPFLKYTLAVVGVFAAMAIISMFKVDSYKFNYYGFASIIGATILIFILSNFAKTQNPAIKNSGSYLMYFITFIFSISIFFLVSSVFFDWPKPVCEYTNDCGQKNESGFIEPDIKLDTCKLTIGVADFSNSDEEISVFGADISSEIEKEFERTRNQYPELLKIINPIIRIKKKVNKINCKEISEKFKLDLLIFGKSCNSDKDSLLFCPIVFYNSNVLDYGQDKITNLSSIQKSNLRQLIPNESYKLFNYSVAKFYLGSPKCDAENDIYVNVEKAIEILSKILPVKINSELDAKIYEDYTEILIGDNNSEVIKLTSELIFSNNPYISKDNKMNYLLNMCDAYSESNNNKKSIEILNNYGKNYLKDINKPLQAEYYNQLGNAYLYENKLTESIFNYELALKVCKDFENLFDNQDLSEELGKINTNLGLAYQSKEDYPNSLKYLFKGLNYRLLVNNEFTICHTYSDIGQAYLEMNRLDSAIIFFEKSIEILTKTKSTMPHIYYNAASVYQKKKMYEQSNYYFIKSMYECDKSELYERSFLNAESIVYNFEQLNLLDSCIEYSKKAIKYAEINKDKKGIAKYLKLIEKYKKRNKK